MKKNLTKSLMGGLVLSILSIASYAQGTWKVDSTFNGKASIAASTAIATGITGLTVMHSDPTGVLPKGDKAVTAVTYGGVTYDNAGFTQGATNGMYYAFRATKAGILDVASKASGNKAAFVFELTPTCPNESDLAALTTQFSTATGATGIAPLNSSSTNVTTPPPTVFDTYNNTSKTWDGTAGAILVAGTVSQYLVQSFAIKANTTYVIGLNGSKMQLRGINYTLTSGINEATAQSFNMFPNPAEGNLVVDVKKSTEFSIYNVQGALVKSQVVTPAANNIDLTGLTSGLYFVKTQNGAQKLYVK